MSSFINPYNVSYGKINNSLINLQIKDIIRMMWPDVSKQDKIINIISSIVYDKDTIKYRQDALKDVLFNRDFYYKLYECVNKLEKCYINYSANASSLSKVKLKSDTSVTETQVILKDFAYCVQELILIFERLDEIMVGNVTSKAFKELHGKVKDVLNNKKYQDLKQVMKEILDSVGSFTFETVLDERLSSQVTKYILSTGKYQGEKISFFKKKNSSGKIDLDSKVMDDFKSLQIDSFYRIVVLLQDVYESLFEKISYIHHEFLFFEVGIAIYDKFWERSINSVFPDISDVTEYKKAYDPFLIVKYLDEGYFEKIYGNDITITEKNDILVIGNNNSGKTVLLRTIGILQILGQCGYTVPATYASIALYESIETIFSGEEKDTDVGGRFEKEVIEISEIIDNVNTKSLVIINEIFQSTFASDGEEALFNILNYFSEINVKWICVSHLLGIAKREKMFYNKIDIYNTTGKEKQYKIEKTN